LIDIAIVAAFIVYGVAVGFVARRRASRSMEEYFLAGRKVRGWRAGASMAATQFAADTPLLVTGLIAAGGVFALWRLWVYAVAFLLMGFLLGPAWRHARVLTDAELTQIRYSARGALTLRALKAVYYGTVINCVVLAFVLVAATRLFELFLPWHEWLPAGVYDPLLAAVEWSGLQITAGVLGPSTAVPTVNNLISIVLMLAFVGLYSTTGGLRAVIATDVMQLALMLVGTAVYAGYAVTAAGGLSALPARLESIYGAERAGELLSFAPVGADSLLPFFVIIGLQWFYQVNADGTGYLAQRTMACADDRQARIAAVVFTLLQIGLRSLLWLLIAVALLVLYPFDPALPATDGFVAGRELTFATGIDRLLPAGARGLMLTAMLAALASTIDTHLNWGASYWSNDLYKAVWIEGIRRRQAAPHQLVRVARWSNVALLAIALSIMVNLGSIQQAWRVSLLFGAGVGAVLVLRWLWERINLYSEVAAIVVSLVLAPVLLLTVEGDWLRLLIMAGVSTVAVLASALWLPGTDPVQLMRFYDRVRPPGFWGQTARGIELDSRAAPRLLGRGLTATLACATSVFAWLIGSGQLLLQQGSVAGNLLCLGVGAVAVPWWWRALRA
jgi:SSS family solute:Na+ symporter